MTDNNSEPKHEKYSAIFDAYEEYDAETENEVWTESNREESTTHEIVEVEIDGDIYEFEKETQTIEIHENVEFDEIDGLRFQFHDDASVTGYAWSAEHFDDDEHTYCEDIEMYKGIEVLNEDDVLASHEKADYATFKIRVNLNELKKAQQQWHDMYIANQECDDNEETA